MLRYIISVSIDTTSTFKGILLVARSGDGGASRNDGGDYPDNIVGTFSDNPVTMQLTHCNNNQQNAVTHMQNVDYEETTTIEWNPPSEDVGDIQFV